MREMIMGFYVIGRYTSCAWFLRLEDAQAEARRLNYRGGTHYTVQAVRVFDRSAR